MYSGRRHIDNGEAMKHNRLVEQERESEHLRRCAESPAYKRVYVRWKKTMAYMQSEQAKVHEAMRQAIEKQQVTNMIGCDAKSIHVGQPLQMPPSIKEGQFVVENPLSALVYAPFFMSKEQLEQMPDDIKAMEVMNKVDEEYDRKVIRMSGFEW